MKRWVCVAFTCLIWVSCGITALWAGPQDVVLTANDISFDVRRREIVASGNVRIQKNQLVIKGTSCRYNHRTRQIQVFDNVRIKWKKGLVSVTCRQLVGDLKKEMVETKGDVTLQYLDYVGRAGKGSFFFRKGRAILTRDPFFIQGKNKIYSQAVYIDMKRNKIRTKGKTRIKVIPMGVSK